MYISTCRVPQDKSDRTPTLPILFLAEMSLVAACIHDALRGTSAATGRRRHAAVAAGPATGAEDVDGMEGQSPPFVAARAATSEDDVGGDAAQSATAGSVHGLSTSRSTT